MTNVSNIVIPADGTDPTIGENVWFWMDADTSVKERRAVNYLQNKANRTNRMICDDQYGTFFPVGMCQNVHDVQDFDGRWIGLPCGGKSDILLVMEDFHVHYAYEGEAGPNGTPYTMPGKWVKQHILVCWDCSRQIVQTHLGRNRLDEMDFFTRIASYQATETYVPMAPEAPEDTQLHSDWVKSGGWHYKDTKGKTDN